MAFSRRLVAVLVGCALAFAAAQGSYSGTRSSLDLMDVDFMFVGAHPDDDGSIMTTFARYILDEGYQGTVVTLTGGEGGSNATGPELGRSLGLIRQEEERIALSLIGVDSPHWLGLQDFYFTLSAEETLAKWGGDEFICDVVRLVRLRRPEVIVTMWPGPGTHGNHQEAGRAATIAFDRAGDPAMCPAQISDEYLQPFTPLKLYYGGSSETLPTTSIPSDDFSRAADMTYADIAALAQRIYRTQGWDQFRTVPVENPRPSQFMLIRSRVPVSANEASLLEGALEPAGRSPAGVRLEVAPASYEAADGVALPVTVTFVNGTDLPMSDLSLDLTAPDGWQVSTTQAQSGVTAASGETVTATFSVVAPESASADAAVTLTGSYQAVQGGLDVAGSNVGWVRIVAPVEVAFEPLFDVAGYRTFAAETHTQQVIQRLPTRLPLHIGAANDVAITVTNRGAAEVTGNLTFDLPAGVTVANNAEFTLAPTSTDTVTVQLNVTDEALPAGRHSGIVPVTVTATVGGVTSTDSADAYVLPTLAVEPAATIVVDGDLSDLAAASSFQISHLDTWQGKADDDADSSGTVYVAYTDEALYVGVSVTDQTVVCNIAANNPRGFHRSDALFVSVDPSGASQDTSTVFQLGVFPCTLTGFEAIAARDGDANQGDADLTAPLTRFASAKTDLGYDVEVSIPWSEMPGGKPGVGQPFNFDVTIFDGDLADAGEGANIRESSISWASFNLGGKQFLPYLWGRLTLAD